MDKKKDLEHHSEIIGFISILFGIISIISILFIPFFGAVFALLGIALGGLALKKNPSTVAKAGLATSALGLLLNVAFFVMFLICFR